MANVGRITLEITLFDDEKSQALIEKIRNDARVVGVSQLS